MSYVPTYSVLLPPVLVYDKLNLFPFITQSTPNYFQGHLIIFCFPLILLPWGKDIELWESEQNFLDGIIEATVMFYYVRE